MFAARSHFLGQTKNYSMWGRECKTNLGTHINFDEGRWCPASAVEHTMGSVWSIHDTSMLWKVIYFTTKLSFSTPGAPPSLVPASTVMWRLKNWWSSTFLERRCTVNFIHRHAQCLNPMHSDGLCGDINVLNCSIDNKLLMVILQLTENMVVAPVSENTYQGKGRAAKRGSYIWRERRVELWRLVLKRCYA